MSVAQLTVFYQFIQFTVPKTLNNWLSQLPVLSSSFTSPLSPSEAGDRVIFHVVFSFPLLEGGGWTGPYDDVQWDPGVWSLRLLQGG